MNGIYFHFSIGHCGLSLQLGHGNAWFAITLHTPSHFYDSPYELAWYRSQERPAL